ncbi:aurora kinase B-like [Oratosquilla oratoria]|uniref:aurora kinase B-like n=1 Tax=Oratosquilla oratoria TaxID=337810 RepID=UPI003F760FF0
MIFLVFLALCRCFQELSHRRKDKSSRGAEVDQASNFATKPIDLTDYEEVLKCNEEALKRCNFTSGWRRVRVLGKGGFGKVFLLENKKLKKRIARKVLFSQPSKRGFTFEEMIQIQLSHPNVLRLFCWEQKMRTLSLNLDFLVSGGKSPKSIETPLVAHVSNSEDKFRFSCLNSL